jgi:hypothetical protein
MPEDDLESYWETIRPLTLPPNEPTLGQLYKPALEITTQERADRYLEVLVDHLQKLSAEPLSRAEALTSVRMSLAYYAGYYDQEVRERVERLYRCHHPILGPVGSTPDPSAILEIGRRIGERVRQGGPALCEHANEVPHECPCPPECYCKVHTCRP